MGDRTAENYVIIPDARDANVLLKFSSGGWTLPTVSVPKHERFWRETAAINAQLESTLLLDATVLRCAAVYRRRDSDARVAVFVVEPHQLNWARPSGTDWFGPDELAGLELAEKEHREILTQYFAKPEGVAAHPWMSRGWMGSTLSWLETEFQRLGLRCVATPDQRLADAFECRIDLHTDRGPFELRAFPAALRHRVALMQQLHRSFARLVPRVLAADAKRGLVFHEPTGVHAAAAEGGDRSAIALRELARVQLGFRDRVEALVAAGVPDLRTAELAGRIDAHFKQLAALTGDDDEVEATALRRLARRVKRFEKACFDLAALGIADSLHHSALSASVRAVEGGGIQIVDWPAQVAHPFLSVAALLRDRAPGEAEREEWIESYLSVFRPAHPEVDLRAAVDLAIALLPIVESFDALARHDMAYGAWERAAELERLVECVRELTAD